SERCSQRSLRSLRMVCAETSKRRARSSTITRPEARAMLRISVWRLDSPATGAPRIREPSMVRRFSDPVNAADRPQGPHRAGRGILVKADRRQADRAPLRALGRAIVDQVHLLRSPAAEAFIARVRIRNLRVGKVR